MGRVFGVEVKDYDDGRGNCEHKSNQLIGLMLAVTATIVIVFYLNSKDPTHGEQSYRFAEVTRGDVRMIIASTGNINPVTTVQVGSQISGPKSATQPEPSLRG